jgi:ribose transport system substrate-binding protein
MKRKNAVAAWAMVALVIVASGCNRQHKPKRISVITGYVDVDTMTERVGLQEAAYREQIDLHLNGSHNRDAQREVELMNAAIAERCHGIAINAASEIAVNTAIRDALALEIPVVVMLHPVKMEPHPHLHFILEDVDASASLVTLRLNELLKGHGEVALFGLNPLFPGSAERFQSVELALRHNAPNIDIDDHSAGPFGNGYLEIAAEQILNEHPHLDAIVALNPESALAAVAVVRQHHLADKVRIIVFDASLQVFHLLREGEIDSLIVQNAREIGNRAVQTILDDRKGHAVSQPMYLKPLLVTKANIDTEDVQQFILLNWRRP